MWLSKTSLDKIISGYEAQLNWLQRRVEDLDGILRAIQVQRSDPNTAVADILARRLGRVKPTEQPKPEAPAEPAALPNVFDVPDDTSFTGSVGGDPFSL